MSDAQPVELSLERSNAAAQPFILRVYDTRGSARKKIAFSETYLANASARNAAEAIKTGRVTYATFKTAEDEHYWRATGKNGEKVVRSATKFGTAAAATVQMDWLKASASKSVIVDNT